MIYSVRRIEYHVFKVRFASDYNQGSRAGEVLPSSRPYPLLSSHEEEYNQSHAVRRIPPHPVFLRCRRETHFYLFSGSANSCIFRNNRPDLCSSLYYDVPFLLEFSMVFFG